MPIDAIALIRAAKAGRTKDAGGDQPTPAAAASVPNTNIAEVERASAEPQRTMEAPPRKAFALSNRLRFQQRLGESLDKFVCEGVPGVYYIPNYVTPEDEKCILDQIYSAEWVQLRNRRLQAIGTQPGPSTVHVKGMVKTIPQWLDQIGSTLQQEGILKQRPNNVLINEYLPGQGILAHEDGPHYEPFVATLSLGAPCVFYFYPHVRTDEIGTKAQGMVPFACHLIVVPAADILTRKQFLK